MLLSDIQIEFKEFNYFFSGAFPIDVCFNINNCYSFQEDIEVCFHFNQIDYPIKEKIIEKSELDKILEELELWLTNPYQYEELRIEGKTLYNL